MTKKFLILSLILSMPGFAVDISGKVIAVRDGNTLQIRTSDGALHWARLLGTLVPTAPGPSFDAARRHLEALVLGRTVTLEWDKSLLHCKTGFLCVKPGKVLRDRLDVNLQQIARGYARHDRSAMVMQSTTDRTLYREAEEDARNKQLGFWRDLASSKSHR